MKNIFIILLTTIAFTSINAQTNLSVNICGNINGITEKEKACEITISQEKLLECPDLMVNIKGWKVSHFMFSVVLKEDDGIGTVVELKTEGNKFNLRMTTIIKKYNPEKIFVENIHLISSKGKSGTGKPLIIKVKK